jgi:hypothetical protein
MTVAVLLAPAPWLLAKALELLELLAEPFPPAGL